MAFERIFNNNPIGILGSQALYELDGEDKGNAYEAQVRALIMDAGDYEETELRPEREENARYYQGLSPSLEGDVDNRNITGDPPLDDAESLTRSSVVSTDVRDTIMAIMPSLMRIFAGSEHSVEFMPNNEGQDEMAKQATNYIRYKFWHENDGFTTLHDACLTCLLDRVAPITWWTDNVEHVEYADYVNVTQEQFLVLYNENPEMEIVEHTIDPTQPGVLSSLKIKYTKSKPQLVIEGVPGEEFRISRRARSIESADLIGREQIIRASEVVKLGYDPDLVYEYTGASYDVTDETYLRDPGGDMYTVTNDLVRYGDFYIRIDSDGDGINELHRICTLGDNYDIVMDEIVARPKYALLRPMLRPYSLIGDAVSALVKDIQKINTGLYRGALDSLTQSIFPRTVINELMTNVDDALNDDVGAVIRTRTDPASAVYSLTTPFVGAQAFEMLAQMNGMKQSRTGISEASKGVDPKALQSTNVMGIDAIITGAQERIELIARVIAETGLKPLYKGLLLEICNNNPPEDEALLINGSWTPFKPSTFDPSMRVQVNPNMGKGSDQSRLMALGTVKQTQEVILEKFGIDNPVVGVSEYRATISDMLAIAGIQNVSRYFKEITPQIQQQIASTPKEPDPNTLLAQAEYEKVKKDMVIATAENAREQTKMEMDDDFRRDKLNVDTFVAIAGILKDIAAASEDTTEYAEPRNQP